MKKIKRAKKTMHPGRTALKIGAGLAAAGAAAGYYFYGSSKAKSHRRAAAKWATAIKKEAIQEAKPFVKRVADELKANWEATKRAKRPKAKKQKV